MSQEQWRAKWQHVCEIGRGGQGTTYEVVALVNPDERGVLKLLRDDSDQQARSRMAHEAINLEALAKELVKVPRLIDQNTQHFSDTSIQLYLVMEYVPGVTLDKALKARSGRLSLEQSVAIASDLCATIASMHKLGVLHRDLKPANLMVRDFDKADLVVLDLGLSFDREAKQESLTRTGETIKNELLALPEAMTATGDRRDARSDITNIVGVLFYCLTGHLPGFLRDERNLAPHQRKGFSMQEILAGDARWEQVEFLLDCGFANDIESRFQTVNEFRQRLWSILDPIGTKKKDPVMADAELGARMRRVDRNLQIQEYIPAANVVAGQIVAHVNSFAGSLKTFTVHFGTISANLPLPAGIDPVLDVQHTIVVGLRTRPQARVTKLYIGAKGDRCVLLRATHIFRGDGRDTPPMAWEEVAWFNPASPPDQQHVADWVNDIVVTAMEEFEKEQPAAGAQTG